VGCDGIRSPSGRKTLRAKCCEYSGWCEGRRCATSRATHDTTCDTGMGDREPGAACGRAKAASRRHEPGATEGLSSALRRVRQGLPVLGPFDVVYAEFAQAACCRLVRARAGTWKADEDDEEEDADRKTAPRCAGRAGAGAALACPSHCTSAWPICLFAFLILLLLRSAFCAHTCAQPAGDVRRIGYRPAMPRREEQCVASAPSSGLPEKF
jgi:hypothetical protein